jgi:hypothetical protein
MQAKGRRIGTRKKEDAWIIRNSSVGIELSRAKVSELERLTLARGVSSPSTWKSTLRERRKAVSDPW